MWPGVLPLVAVLITLLHLPRCSQGKVDYRAKEKEVLDDILGEKKYDARIRPGGENGTAPAHHPAHLAIVEDKRLENNRGGYPTRERMNIEQPSIGDLMKPHTQETEASLGTVCHDHTYAICIEKIVQKLEDTRMKVQKLASQKKDNDQKEKTRCKKNIEIERHHSRYPRKPTSSFGRFVFFG